MCQEEHPGPVPEDEWILTRLMRLDRRACPRLRAAFCPGPSRWYVDCGRIVLAGPQGGFCSLFGNGETPQVALLDTWKKILENLRIHGWFLLIYACPPNVSIPGDDPQVWVRWNAELDDWEDVSPLPELLELRAVPRERIRSYQEHRCLQQS